MPEIEPSAPARPDTLEVVQEAIVVGKRAIPTGIVRVRTTRRD